MLSLSRSQNALRPRAALQTVPRSRSFRMFVRHTFGKECQAAPSPKAVEEISICDPGSDSGSDLNKPVPNPD